MMLYINGLQQTAPSSYDLLTRAVMISLFTWRRAETDDAASQPNGWWGDSWPGVPNDRIGSRLWLLSRSKLTNQTVPVARDYIRQALQWMTEDGVTVRNDVQVIRSGIDQLAAEIILWRHDGSRHNITFDDIWSELHG